MEDVDPEEQFLRDARNGDLAGIERLLLSATREETHININCKGARSPCDVVVVVMMTSSINSWGSSRLLGHMDILVRVVSGKSKSNLGWTPLHLACYFGHKDVAEKLLKVFCLYCMNA